MRASLACTLLVFALLAAGMDLEASSVVHGPAQNGYVYVAGVEGSGHHGVVFTLLRFLANETVIRRVHGPIHDPEGVAQFTITRGFPSGVRPRLFRPGTVRIAWESLPSQREIPTADRLAMLYRSAQCVRPRCHRSRRLQYSGSSRAHWKRDDWPTKWLKCSASPACLVGGQGVDGGGVGGQPRQALDSVVAQVRQMERRVNMSHVVSNLPQFHSSPRKVLFLWRDFALTGISHAKWDAGLEGHVTMLAAHLVLLANELPTLPPSVWAILEYDAMFSERARPEVVAKLSEFLGWGTIPPVDLEAASGRIFARWHHSPQTYEGNKAGATQEQVDFLLNYARALATKELRGVLVESKLLVQPPTESFPVPFGSQEELDEFWAQPWPKREPPKAATSFYHPPCCSDGLFV